MNQAIAGNSSPGDRAQATARQEHEGHREPVIAVESVANFIDRIAEADVGGKDFRGLPISGMTWFRGHADSGWAVEPRLYREGLFRYERSMISDAMRLLPTEFSHLSRFSTLAKLQHYGLPTRLLDVTSNPLVALYFACQSADGNGEIIAFTTVPTGGPDTYPTPTVMEYVFEHASDSVCEEDLLAAVAHLDPLAGRRTVTPRDIEHALSIPWASVVPEMNNRRLSAQSGAFLMFGMQLVSRTESDNPGNLGRHYLRFDPAPADSDASRQFQRRFSVPREAKASILRQLDVLNVNRRSLFPEPEHQLRYVYEQYKHGSWHGFSFPDPAHE